MPSKRTSDRCTVMPRREDNSRIAGLTPILAFLFSSRHDGRPFVKLMLDNKLELEAMEHLRTPDFKSLPASESKPFLKIIKKTALSDGLPGEDIWTLIKFIGTADKLPLYEFRLVYKALIPETVVPINAAVNALTYICRNDISAGYKELIIKWFVAVWEHGLLENTEKLHALYDIIFTIKSF